MPFNMNKLYIKTADEIPLSLDNFLCPLSTYLHFNLQFCFFSREIWRQEAFALHGFLSLFSTFHYVLTGQEVKH